MKQNRLFVKTFISCFTFACILLAGDFAFADSASEETANDPSQKLAQIAKDKEHFKEKSTDISANLTKLSTKIQQTQKEIDGLKTLAIQRPQTIIEVSQQSPFLAPIIEKEKTLTPIENREEEQLTLLENRKLATEELQVIKTQQQKLSKEETVLTQQLTKLSEQKNKQTDTRSAIISAAKTHLGKPYVYGAAGPDAFDCSGLVQVAFAAAGRPIGRTTIAQEAAGTPISVGEAQTGDLVFWGSPGGTYHVGISLGDGSYIHAPVPGDVVQVATVASYAPDFAVRIA